MQYIQRGSRCHCHRPPSAWRTVEAESQVHNNSSIKGKSGLKGRPVSCEHDVVFVELLPTVVLPRAPVLITGPAPRLLSANSGVGAAPCLRPGG